MAIRGADTVLVVLELRLIPCVVRGEVAKEAEDVGGAFGVFTEMVRCPIYANDEVAAFLGSWTRASKREGFD